MLRWASRCDGRVLADWVVPPEVPPPHPIAPATNAVAAASATPFMARGCQRPETHAPIGADGRDSRFGREERLFCAKTGTSAYVQGILLAIAAGVVPAVCYYALGRVPRANPIALGAVFVVSLVPFYLLMFFTALGVLDLVQCPPHATDCPI
jgi:hypothetical protein